MVELPEDNPLASRYVAVQRVYETIPGPVITGKKLDSRGDLETINVQTVAAGTSPDADGLLVTETKVDPVDSVKSTKTTARVSSYATLTTKANKAGLLGDTSTTDDIVSPSTNPDDLSITVLESTVEQVTTTKARKRTTTSTGPTSLTGDEKKGGLLGITETVESIVVAGASPDNLSTTVLQSSVTPIDSAKSKKVTITASGPTELDGATLQEFGIASTKEKIVTSGNTPTVDYKTIKAEVSPIDDAKSKLSQVDYSDPTKISGYQYDEFFEKNLNISREIINSSTGALSHYNGLLSYKDEPVNPYQKQRIIVDSNGNLPPSRTEYRTASYSSPQLVFSLDIAYTLFSTDGSDVRVRITPVTRSAQSRITIQRVTTSYSFGAPSDPNPSFILSPELKRVAYTVWNMNFDLGDGLCDTITSNVVSGFIGGNLSQPIGEYINIPSTTISATAYSHYINTWKITSYEQQYWKAGIWVARTVETYIV
jgi:hypothetical protein